MEKEWGARLVEVVAGEIRRYRTARGMSTQQLSSACKELGWPIQRSVLSNLELGYRETITVPELLVISKALGVPPVQLVFPLGHQHTIEALPGSHPEAWMALKWFTGEMPWPGELHREPDGRWFIDSTPDDMADWNTYGLPVQLYREHDQHLGELDYIRNRSSRNARVQRDDEERARLDEEDRRAERLAKAALRGVRERMRQAGIQPPELHPKLADVDEQPRRPS